MSRESEDGQRADGEHQMERLELELARRNEQIDRLENQLHAARRYLREQSRMATLGKMTAEVAHELKNPVNFIHGGGAALVEILEDPALDTLEYITKLRKLGAVIQTGGERIRHFTDSLNVYRVRGTSGPNHFELREVLESVLALLAPLARRKVVTIEIREIEPATIQWNQGDLCEVLIHLLRFAIEASNPHDRVNVDVDVEGSTAILSVRDHGHGIEPEIQKRVFEPITFTERLETDVPFGLCISRDLVEQGGGRLELESELGIGTTFKVILPVQDG